MDESINEKALSLAKQIQQNNQSSLTANLLLAKVYLRIPTGLRQAEVFLRICLELDANHHEVVYLLAKVLCQKGDYKGAIEM